MEVSRILQTAKADDGCGIGRGGGSRSVDRARMRLRIAGKSAKITTAFAKVGLSGDFGGTYFLTKLVGPSKRGTSTSPRRC